MGLKVYWTDFAKNELRNIYDYYRDKAGIKIGKKTIKQIVEKAELLKNFPEMGVIEELLIERPQKFRFIVISNFKIIYWVNVDRIEIIDVFDSRQNPIKMERNT